MKLAIDVTYTPSGGSLTQIINTVNYLKKEKNINFTIYSKKKNRHIFLNLNNEKHKIIESKFSNISALTRVIWQQLFLPYYLVRDKIDLLFCPGDISPIFCPTKKVQWIGTIAPFWNKIYSYKIGIQKRFKYPLNKFLMYKSAQNADMLIFESDYTRKYFQERYNILTTKTKVINIGKDECFVKNPLKYYSEYNLLKPFVLCVSHLYPYKNIDRVITSFYLANSKNNNAYKLIIAGASVSKQYTNRIKKIINCYDYNENVILIGSVDRNSLQVLYSNCEFFIFPSPCENFAYTLVEAMCCGAPIICSNTTAMPETCQEAAIYFDPNSTEDIAEKIELLITDVGLRKSLSRKSLERVNELPDYKEVTTTTLDIIKDIVDIN